MWPGDAFLMLWMLGFLGMMVVVMDWVAGRYYFIVASGVALSAVRLIEIQWPDRAPRIIKGFLAALLVAGAALAFAHRRELGR